MRIRPCLSVFILQTGLVALVSAQFVALQSDFTVSAQTGQYVYRPSVTASPNGQYAISWGDERTTSDGRLAGVGSIYGSLYQPNGTAVASNFRVDGLSFGFFSDFSLYHSSAKFLSSGALIIAYHVDARATVESIKFDDIYYAAFTSAGVRTTVDVQVNKVGGSGSGYGYQPSLSTHGPNFVVTYRYYVSDAYNIGISTVDGTSGALLGDAIPISSSTTNNRVYPFIASNGTHVVSIWTDARTDATTGDIYMQRYVNGSASGGNVKVNSDAVGGYNQFGRVAMNVNGDFVVVWIDTRSHAGGDLYARLYNSSGVAQGAEFKLTSSNSSFQAYPPGVVMDVSGDFVVTWADSVAGQLFTAKTRAFSSTGAALTPITELTTSFATAPSIQPDVALGPGGVLVYGWIDGRLDADKGRIFAKTATVAGITDVESIPEVVPSDFGLEPNYPNPFNPETRIGWKLRDEGWARVTVVDLLGREVAVLAEGVMSAGSHAATWYAQDMPTGIYIVRLESSVVPEHRKITLLR